MGAEDMFLRALQCLRIVNRSFLCIMIRDPGFPSNGIGEYEAVPVRAAGMHSEDGGL